MKRMVLRLIPFIILIPYTVVFGDELVFVRATNVTTYYLHIIINGQPFLYVAPQRTASLEVEGSGFVTMEAFYSPGQGISGSTVQTAEINEYVVDCSSGNGCQSGEGTSSINPLVWTITADMLQN